MARRRRSRSRAVMFCGLLLAAPPSEARPLTAEDVVELERASDPQIAPAGDRVAFVVGAYRDDRTLDEDVWLVSVEGGEPQRLTDRPGPDRHPRWSPAGGTLGLVAHPLGQEARIEVFTIDSGSLSPLPGSQGARDFRWSPDGSRIALLRTDPASADDAQRQESDSDGRVVGESERHTGLWLLDINTGAQQRLSPPGQTVWSFNWSPDGKSIAALSSVSPQAEGLEYGSRLVRYDLETGTATILTERTNPQAAPSYSPDGRWIAYLGPVGEFKERGIVHVVESNGGEPQALLPRHRGNVWDLRWHPKDNRLLIAMAEGPVHRLLTLSLPESLERLLEMHHSIIPYWDAAWTVSADGRWITYLSEEDGRPADVWIAPSDGSQRRRLTRLNRHLDDVDLGTVEAVRWHNLADGAEVEGILVTPPAHRPGQRRPLIVWLHGGPAYNWGLGAQVQSWAQLFAAHGYVVLLPNFRGSSGYGMDWMMANVRDWGDGPLGDVLGGVDHLVGQGIADSDRLFVGGGSYGGYLTYWTVTHEKRFKAAFVRAGVSDVALEYALTDEPSFLVGYFNAKPYDEPELYRQASPVTFASDVETPLLIVHGENDARVPLSQSLLLHAALQHYGVPVRLVVFPREGHSIREYAHQIDAMKRALAWYERWDRPPAGTGADDQSLLPPATRLE